jgi:hypothetical protein
MQSLPYSFHVLATQHSIASVYPTPTQCVSAFDPIWTCPWAFAEAPPLPCHALDTGTDPRVPLTFD